jgi:hypothetical protein
MSHADPLWSDFEKKMLWRCRGFLVDKPYALPRFLLSVPWADYKAVIEAHQYVSSSSSSSSGFADAPLLIAFSVVLHATEF